MCSPVIRFRCTGTGDLKGRNVLLPEADDTENPLADSVVTHVGVALTPAARARTRTRTPLTFRSHVPGIRDRYLYKGPAWKTNLYSKMYVTVHMT